MWSRYQQKNSYAGDLTWTQAIASLKQMDNALIGGHVSSELARGNGGNDDEMWFEGQIRQVNHHM